MNGLKRQNRRHSIKAALAALFLAALGGMAQQAAPRGTVTGVVTRAGNPVGGASVMLLSGVSSLKLSTTTDRKGVYTFAGFPVGGVEVQILDPDGRVIASVKGALKAADETISIPVAIP